MLGDTDRNALVTSSHIIPSNVAEDITCPSIQTPLCTLIVTFSNSQGTTKTAAHVFTVTTSQLYPQTRRTVYQNETPMSLTTTPQSTDDEHNWNVHSSLSPQISRCIVQEVSLSYSPPYTSVSKKTHDRELLDLLHMNKENPGLPKLKHWDSTNTNFVDHSSDAMRIETEFPANATKPVPYFSAQSAIESSRITPTSTPRASPTFGEISLVGNKKNFSQNSLISKNSTIFEELTTITRTKSTSKNHSEMPTVNALTKQFELSAQQEKSTPLYPRKHSNASPNQNGSAKSRVVVIDKSEKYSTTFSTRPVLFCPPTGILTTTIVDIDPRRSKQRIEELEIMEEHIITTHNIPPFYREEHNPPKIIKQYGEAFGKTQERLESCSVENLENIESYVDTSPIDGVKNVIGQFENKFQNTSKIISSEKLRSVSRVDMNDNNSEPHREVIVHQIEKLPVEQSNFSPFLSSQRKTTQTEIVQNYRDNESVKDIQELTVGNANLIKQEANLETIVSMSITPSPTIDSVEKLLKEDDINETIIKPSSILETSTTQEVVTKKQKTEVNIDQAGNDIDNSIKNETEITESKPDEHDFSNNVIDTELKIKMFEEWSTTQKQRNISKSPDRQSLNLYSPLSYRSKSVDRASNSKFPDGVISRAFSGRGLASGAYTGGIISGNLVSGMSSAGAICTTQIRDTREREKREIGLLNDRLADYIEKVRFLEAQNQCLSHDIDILRRGFSGGGHVSSLFDSEITQAKRQLDSIVIGRTNFEKDITALSAEIEIFRNKWLEAISVVKAHREDHDVDLDRLAKIEADISLFKRKIRIVEEDVIRIRRENDGIYNEIARIRGQTHSEIALKNERSLHVTDLLQRIKLLQTENSTRIEQELVFINRDTTSENRDYFRHELQAAIRDIRADYEAISLRNRQDIEVWYREQIRKIQIDAGRVNVDLYKDEIISIRSTLTGVKSRLAELESRNYMLEKLITDLGNQQAEEARFFEMTLAEKDAAIAKLRDQCTELSIQMEKLCDHETSLRAEIERYRVLLNGANVTTHISHVGPISDYRRPLTTGGTVGTTRVVSQTTRTHSSSNTSYTGLPASRNSGISIGANIGGVSVGGTVGVTHSAANVSGSVAGSEKRLDRVHDETGTDDFGRNFHRWYLGTISVNQVTNDFIELKNICKIRRVDVGGFRVEQSVNGHVIGSAVINVPLILDPQEKLRINTKNIGQFFMNVENMNISTSSRTSLFNYTDPDQERGWFVYLN